MEDTALLSVPARLAKRLLSLAGAFGGTKVVLSQEELAQFLGVSRLIVNQHLQAWRGKGWIAQGRGSFKILDSQELRRVTEE